MIPALSRLSYIPARKTPETGFEPASFRLTAGRYCQSSSSGLRPTDGGRRTRTTDLAFMRGLLFPLSYAAETGRSERRESNSRHLAWQASALTHLSYAHEMTGTRRIELRLRGRQPRVLPLDDAPEGKAGHARFELAISSLKGRRPCHWPNAPSESRPARNRTPTARLSTACSSV